MAGNAAFSHQFMSGRSSEEERKSGGLEAGISSFPALTKFQCAPIQLKMMIGAEGSQVGQCVDFSN